MGEEVTHVKKCLSLAALIGQHSDILRLATEYFENNPAPWVSLENEEEEAPSSKRRKKCEDMDEELKLVESCLKFLLLDRNYFCTVWQWSSFFEKYLNHTSFEIRWLTCHCFGIVMRLSELQRSTLISKNLSTEDADHCSLLYSSTLTSAHVNGSSEVCQLSEELSYPSVEVCGISLPTCCEPSSVESNSLFLVNSTVSNLRNLALAVAANKIVCLSGPVGCGKTSAVQYLAQVTGRMKENKLLKVQLGEETDSKMLLGSYKCTDIPGEFIWQPGVLTKAVTEGMWLLLEDIDAAGSDVASVLVSLMENKYLSVPGFRDNITPHLGFHLFLTQRSMVTPYGEHTVRTNTIELLEKQWLKINFEPLTKEELITLVKTKFPALSTFSNKMVDAFLLFSVGNHILKESDINDIIKSTGRLASTRDLMKWCVRAVVHYEVSSNESALQIFQDALDIFCCSVSNNAIRIKLACAVASCLGIIQTKAEFYFNLHKPSINLTPTRIEAGRILLKRQSLEEVPAMLETNQLKNFAFTRISSCLIERIACCLSFNEPVLLVGETGTGKTASLQLLAKHSGNQLVVLNLNQQSDSADLLGGYKPVDLKFIIAPIRDEFEAMFRKYFKVEPNLKFLQHVSNCFNNQNWKNLVKLMNHSCKTALKRLVGIENQEKEDWKLMNNKINKLEIQINHGQPTLAFRFIEGTLVRALRNGHWVLLDEINLATAETLQCLSGLLEDGGTLSLLEKDDTSPIQKHPNFRIMAAMNPATDVGKKDLPPGIRNRFTELFVDELSDMIDIMKMIVCYLKNITPVKCENIAKFYLRIKKEAATNLTDGVGQKPHYSLRTLCRALSIAAANPCNNAKKSLYEAFCLSFLTQLDLNSHKSVQEMVLKMIVGQTDSSSVLTQPIPEPTKNGPFVNFEGYWIQIGSLEPKANDKYVLTPTVRSNLRDLVRVVSLADHPVLLQGDTSIGKTSLIMYLASASGNKCLRINNHEHTDLQEYIGSYCADAETGQLVFREGVLVEAMRHGYWIILDELNLAPTDVLEALNRVLDDNRELYIPETQEVIRANPKFRLFATQNPPGSYGGRKIMSRAFRNRFIELHFGEIPPNELETILHQRCDMPLSYCKKIIYVMRDLQAHRRGSAAFAGKSGFITLRDLFRWGERYRLASGSVGSKFYDWDQHIADEGFLVLAGRVRKVEEREIIRKSIEKHIKRTVDPNTLFNLNEKTSTVTKHILEKYLSHTTKGFEHLVWTYNMRQMIVLIGKAMEFKEPLLLVGETGCGKTSVCQVIASCNNQQLFIVNCHQHSESSDFLGGLRPVRDHSSDSIENSVKRLFEWVDGPLIKAMNDGEMFLADEISLADDSVLERLNSLLEPERKILVSEKTGLEEIEEVTAEENFRFIGTMNPGGDYGKKELSPALRNRLTEIWCESCSEKEDLLQIIEHNIRDHVYIGNQEDGSSGLGRCMLDFFTWLQTSNIGKRLTVSIRDILTWVNFVNMTTNKDLMRIPLEPSCAYVHGACLTLLDSLGSGLTGIDNIAAIKTFRESAVEFVLNQMKPNMVAEKLPELHSLILPTTGDSSDLFHSTECFGISPFFIKKGNLSVSNVEKYSFNAGTTRLNLIRLLRSLQIPSRALLLEGSPGVGKTTLVQALAQASGHSLVRINLSEQTDVSDLFGADLPVDGGEGGQFQWRDGPFLKALKDGDWILLDELNLASQSVLEGLNAVLDHRGELFIPELGKTFNVSLGKTRLFACQNPLSQGGARRGLPRSFLNRFTQVFMEPLSDSDLNTICLSLYPFTSPDLLKMMINFNSQLSAECGVKWAFRGAPWEMNLRDLSRWLNVMYSCSSDSKELFPGKYVSLLFAGRMRTLSDKQKVLDLYEATFGDCYPLMKETPRLIISQSCILFDDVILKRCEQGDDNFDDNVVESSIVSSVIGADSDLLILREQIDVLRSLAVCVKMNWMPILIGESGSGKSSVVRVLAQLCNRELRVLSVNSAMDTMEILGGFEQADFGRHLDNISVQAERLVLKYCQEATIKESNFSGELLSLWEKFKKMSQNDYSSVNTLASETALFSERLKILKLVLNRLRDVFLKRVRVISKLISQLSMLEANLIKTGSLNAGGKFEWVDSVLVKCLREGSWLLIDNVNLCSSAVLDRLNGLLEPNGVLTVGERGVDSTGAVPVIKPHPQFRLFLAMNPQYGEISRAMRNRGVEISLLNDEQEVMNELDLAALLAKVGIKEFEHRHCLLTIHDTMKQLPFGFDSISVPHLLHVAFLLVQFWKRGFSFLSALKSSCFEVYIKSRSLNFNQKEIARRAFTKSLHDCEKYLNEKNLLLVNQDSCEKRLRNHFKHLDSTLSTLSVQNNSKLAVVKCQTALPEALLKLLSDLTISRKESNLYDLEYDICAFFQIIYPQESENQHSECPKIADLLLKLLISLFHSASMNDFELRLKVLHDVLQGLSREDDRVKEYLNLTSEVCRRFVTLLPVVKDMKFEDCGLGVDQCALPIDSRRFVVNFCQTQSPVWSNENKLFVLMNLMLIQGREAMSKNSIDQKLTDKKWKEMTVAMYSYAFTQGCVSNVSVSDLIIEKFYTFMVQFDQIIETVLSTNEVELSTSAACKFYAALHWRHRFMKLGSLKLFIEQTSSKQKSHPSEDVMQLLTVHFKWIVKKLIPHLLDILVTSPNIPNLPSIKEFFELLESIDSSLNYVAPPLLTVMNKLRQRMNEPLPIADEKEAVVLSSLEKLNEFSSVWPTDPNIDVQMLKLKSKVPFLSTSEWNKIRLLASSALQAVTEDKLDKAETFAAEAMKLYDALNPETDDDSSTKPQSENSISPIQLWPILEFFALKLNRLWRINLLSLKVKIPDSSNLVNELNDDDLAFIPAVFKQSPSIPAKVSSLLSSSIGSDRSRNVELNLLNALLEHSRFSPAIHNFKFWLDWNKKKNRAEEDVENIFMDTSTESSLVNDLSSLDPSLTVFVAGLILSDLSERNYSIVATSSLKDFDNKVLMLKQLAHILWRNKMVLSDSLFINCKNEEVMLKQTAQNFVNSLQASFYVDQTDHEVLHDANMFSNNISLCISKLDEFSSKMSTYSSTHKEKTITVNLRALKSSDDSIKDFKHCLRQFASSINDLSNEIDGNDWLLISRGWIHLGLTQLVAFTYLESVDPVEKNALKFKYAEEELGDVKNMLLAEELHSKVHDTSNRFPFLSQFSERAAILTERKAFLKQNIALRPQPPLYNTLSKELKHFISTLGSFSNVTKLSERMTECHQKLQQNEELTSTLKTTKQLLREHRSWQTSTQRFYNHLTRNYGSWYRDIVTPIQYALNQLMHGLALLSSLVNKSLVQAEISLKKAKTGVSFENVSSLFSTLAKFPQYSIQDALNIVNVCSSRSTLLLLNEAVKATEISQQLNVTFSLIRCSLQEIHLVINSQGNLKSKNLLAEINQLLSHLVRVWQKQEEEKKRKLEEEESLYLTKTCAKSKTDDEEAAEEMSQLFASFDEVDFHDFATSAVLDSSEHPKPFKAEGVNISTKLTNECIEEICQLHSKMMIQFSRASWISAFNLKSDVKDTDFMEPFIDRFNVFSILFEHHHRSLDESFDGTMLPSLLFLTHCAQNILSNNALNKKVLGKTYNFYHDSNITEIKECIPVLNAVKLRVGQLLVDWPEHPTLNSIIQIADRILNFSASSPVARFLTGFEMILNKMHEWEEVAHSGVSLMNESQEITGQIFKWRKLELRCWKNSLSNVSEKMKSGSSKWWFHLYSLTYAYTNPDPGAPEVEYKEFVETIQKFVESATLGDFEPRLDLLYVFHCHATNLPHSKKQTDVRNVLWNLHLFYSQFLPEVLARIKDLGAPVQKDLSDFIKIARWNDTNYWTVKETVKKTHRFLHKCIKKYQTVLNESVTTAMLQLEESPKTKALSSEVFEMNISNFISNPEPLELETFQKLLHSQMQKLSENFQSNVFKKVSKISKQTFLSTSYPILSQTLDNFTAEIIESTDQLRDLQVDLNLTKEKQKSQAKSIHQRKRKALIDLFQALQKIGLGYQAGLVMYGDQVNVPLEFARATPFNIANSLQHLKTRYADHDLLAVWDGSERHFLRNIAKHAQLRKAFGSTHKSMNTPYFRDRLKGLPNHLVNLTMELKQKAAKSFNSLCQLRSHVSIISDMSEERLRKSAVLQEELLKLKDDYEALLDDAVYGLQGFRVLLSVCPESMETLNVNQEEPLAIKLKNFEEPLMVKVCKDDLLWQKVNCLVDSLLVQLKGMKEELSCSLRPFCFNLNESLSFVSVEVKEVLNKGMEAMVVVQKGVEEIRKLFSSEKCESPLAAGIVSLNEKMKGFMNRYAEDSRKDAERDFADTDVAEVFQVKLSKLANKILFILQELYKKFCVADESNATNNEENVVNEKHAVDDDEDSELLDLEKHHLTKKIVSSLNEDLEIMDLKNVNRTIGALLKQLISIYDSAEGEICKRMLVSCLPLLDQLSLTAQFIVTQQVKALRTSSKLSSVLMSVFLELVQKGFCIPDELLEEEGEGEGAPSDGLGLGDGKGEKDVSEEIESQDQLEDAKKPGEKEEEYDEDTKEEEKGINMSDDFGGKMQDVDQKDEDDSDESGEEEEPDKEMAETEEGAETLDEKVWGSDSEGEEDEQENDGKELNEEEGDKGEQVGDKELGAKDDTREEQPNEDGGNDQNDENNKRKDINELDDDGEEDEEQVDPYHGKDEPQPEPEAFDLPDNLQLDDDEGNDKENDEENPFDIDAMKQPNLPEDKDENNEDEKENEDENDEGTDEKKDEDEADMREEENENEDEEGKTGNDEPDEDASEEKEEEEKKDAEDGGKMDDEKSGEEPKETEDQPENERAKPSADDASLDPAQQAEQVGGSSDQVESQQSEEKKKDKTDSNEENQGDDQKGVGDAKQETSDGHSGAQEEGAQSKKDGEKDKKRKQKPGKSDINRTLAELKEPMKKRLKTTDDHTNEKDQEEKEKDEDGEETDAADMYQHVKNAEESASEAQTLDAATEEQAEKQPVPNSENDEKSDVESLAEDDKMDLDEDEDLDVEKVDEIKPKETKSKEMSKNKASKDADNSDEEFVRGETGIEIEGDVVPTMTVDREPESSYHTQQEVLDTELQPEIWDVATIRDQIENQLASWTHTPSNDEASKAWQLLTAATHSLAQDLSEQLRLVLEPCQATRLKGDFRTGRRINMRKVIPYIASQFRKDKIWLRRTKPSKRDYQIIMAVDDSSSMSDSHSKELAFESLATISRALSLLEAGELGVVKFGEESGTLHPLGEAFSEHTGARLLQKFSFEQKKTRVAELVEYCVATFAARQLPRSAQLLIILSDGRGILSEGQSVVKRAVRRARLAGIFIVFVIIDNPVGGSVLDISMPLFRGNQLIGMSSYMDNFPFPFYLLLRDVNNLPAVLSDALRQWFELVTDKQ